MGEPAQIAASASRQDVVVEVDGRRIQVSMPTSLLPDSDREVTRGPAPKRKFGGSAAGAASGDSVKAPMQATVVKVAVEEGQTVEAGDLVVVLEAMKMEQPLTAHKDGVVAKIDAPIGTTVGNGHVLLNIIDA